jgi:hypothetical protein
MKEVHNERVVAASRIERSAALLSISMRPSSAYRVSAVQRVSA